MDQRAYFGATCAITLVLATVLYWTWVTPEKMPVVGRSRLAREMMSGAIASLIVSAVLLTVALFGVGSSTRFLPTFVFAVMGVTALFIFYLVTVIPTAESARNVAIRRVWDRLMGVVCLGYFLTFLPRLTGLHGSKLYSDVVFFATILPSIGLCWYSYRYRDSLGRTKNAVGVLQLFAPLILATLLRSIR